MMKDETKGTISVGLKQAIMTISLILILVGLPLSIGFLCVAVPSYSDLGIILGAFSFLAVVLTLGVGLVTLIHISSSIGNKPSKPMLLPPMPLMIGVFVLLLMVAVPIFIIGDALAGFFFPPLLILLAALPPLWAVAWFMSTDSVTDTRTKPDLTADLSTTTMLTDDTSGRHITWRRGTMAFIGGGTIGVFVALLLEILLPVIVFALVFDLADVAFDRLDNLFDALAGSRISEALTNRGFIYIFIQLAVIAPLAEEIAKPLALLPILRQLNRREAFLLGAFAGAGFAAVENVIYAASGDEIWSGILLVRALGGALHPLGAGLMALAWRDILNREPNAASNWLTRFAIAVGVHAAWNGGSLLVITLGGAGFFGELPDEIGILGVSAAGGMLAFLILLGIAALWIGRAFGRGESPSLFPANEQTGASLPPSERTLAIWALACLTAIVPIGIAGLSLWLR
ncbi:MAG: PrsW family intramembrane metalloprotease [Chloroflexi bacterium]|nr:PrsW family intramembrane metalloprotease [Chloroflexota bacterium]